MILIVINPNKLRTYSPRLQAENLEEFNKNVINWT